MKKYEWTDASGLCPIIMTLDQAAYVAHQGDCTLEAEKVAHALNGELSIISNKTKMDTLREYGAWDDEELEAGNTEYKGVESVTDNNCRLVWLAANDIVEDPERFEI